jgi:hypothetical protein
MGMSAANAQGYRRFRRRIVPVGATIATLFLGFVAVAATSFPMELIRIGKPNSLFIVRAFDGRLYFIQFDCTDPNSPIAMRPEFVNHRKEWLKPLDWSNYYNLSGYRDPRLLKPFDRREIELGLYRHEHAIGLRLKPVFIGALVLYCTYLGFVIRRRVAGPVAPPGFPMD